MPRIVPLWRQSIMPDATDERVVRDIMEQFARNTGLSKLTCSPQRYLWTDAFAVCNFPQLYRRTGQKDFCQYGQAELRELT